MYLIRLAKVGLTIGAAVGLADYLGIDLGVLFLFLASVGFLPFNVGIRSYV